jgi:hypothetical protein
MQVLLVNWHCSWTGICPIQRLADLSATKEVWDYTSIHLACVRWLVTFDPFECMGEILKQAGLADGSVLNGRHVQRQSNILVLSLIRRMMWRRRTQARSVSPIVCHLMLLLDTHRWQRANHNHTGNSKLTTVKATCHQTLGDLLI